MVQGLVLRHFTTWFRFTSSLPMTTADVKKAMAETPMFAEGDNKFASLARRIYDGLGAMLMQAGTVQLRLA